jgi:PleD family two-component response regulator
VRQSDSFINAFKRADKALYQAKINGKNQIIIC